MFERYILILSITASLLGILTFCQDRDKTDSKNYPILLSFEADSIGKINSCEKFTIDFILNKRRYQGEINKCELLLPNFSKEFDSIDIEFSYENYKLNFPNVPHDWLFAKQKIAWHFKMKYPPFDESGNERINLDEVKEIHYMQIDPFDFGQSIEIINPVITE